MSSRFPFPPYPNGWFQVAYSDELANGAVQPLKYFGRDLVLFRDNEGKAHVLDAHCPHLGAHLGHGGEVTGNSIRCPFHAWCFDGSGACTEVPYAKKIPPKARVNAWNVREVNGLILVWYHGAGLAPQWEVPVIPEYQAADWTPYQKRRWTIRTRCQEMAENSVDSAHFRYLHKTQNLPDPVADMDGHKFHMRSSTVMMTKGGEVEGWVESNLHGFGFVTTRFTGLVETLLVSSSTSIDEEHVDVRFSFSVKDVGHPGMTRGIGKAFIAEIERQLGQDIPIWENKVYFDKPMLCDGDGPIALFRRWVRGLYSDPDTVQLGTGDAPAQLAV
jgi:phenylpropionate dioxygenase-like ring-hydroxylating dioxygenase large terminal subunit